MKCACTCNNEAVVKVTWGSNNLGPQTACLCDRHSDELWGMLNPLLQLGTAWVIYDAVQIDSPFTNRESVVECTCVSTQEELPMTDQDFTDWSPDICEIGDKIADLTLIQAVALGNYLEEVHGIKASGGVPLPPPEDEKPPEKPPEQTEFDLILDGYPEDKKITVIKVYREVTGAAIKQAKDFIEQNIGKPLKQGLTKSEAEVMKVKFESAGAKVSIK